jgi:hypothetical protein
VSLHHRSHRTVHDEDAAGEMLFEERLFAARIH